MLNMRRGANRHAYGVLMVRPNRVMEKKRCLTVRICAGHSVPPPDPAVFNELAEVVREMLTESLQRFVLATYNNVGTPRAVCGSAGGIVIGMAGRYVGGFHFATHWAEGLHSIPLIINFAVRGNRWWRLAAIPGMWAGLTIFVSAMYGVCMRLSSACRSH